MSESRGDLGFYALPILPSFANIDSNINKGMGQALAKFGDIGKKSGKELAQGLGGGLGDAEALVKKTTATYERFRDRAEDAVGRVRVAEEKLAKAREGGKADQIAAAEERLAKAQRDSARVAKDAEEASRRVAAARRAEESATKATELAVASLGRSGDTASRSFLEGLQSSLAGARDIGQDAADGFSGGLAGAASLGRIGLAAAGVGASFATGFIGAAVAGVAAGAALLLPAVKDGMQTQAIEDLFQSRIGVDDETMERLGGGAGLAYAHGFGESVADNLTATQAAFRSGLLDPTATDTEVAHLVEKLQGLSMATEAEAGELSRSISKLIRNGLADSVAEASDIITAGFQRGLNESGDWLDTINEYSTQARKFGLDAAEYMTLLSQGVKAGARDTDTVADSLAEFSKLAVDGSKSTREGFEALGLDADDMARRFAAGGDSAKMALGATLEALGRIEDPLQQSLAWTALFGTRFEDMGDAVNAFDLDPAKNEFLDLQGISDRSTKAATDNFASEWQAATNSVSQWFADLKTDIADWFTDLPVIRDVPDMIRSVFDPTYYDIKAPDWADPGTPLTPQSMLDQLAGPGPTGPQSLDDMLLPQPGSGTPLPAAPAPPVAGTPTPILTDAQAQAQADAEELSKTRTRPAPLFPGGLDEILRSSYAGDAALLANVPAGRYEQTQNADLTQGLADCSSAVEDLVNILDGRPTGGRSLSTHNADEWLTAHGFLPGSMPGAFNVGFNDGHMQATLPGGTPFNWGSDASAAQRGIGGTGASDPSFTSHYYRPVGPSSAALERLAATAGSGSPIVFRGTGQGTPGVDENGTPGFWQVDAKTVREADQRAADAIARITDADTAVALALARVNELDADASESQRLSAEDAVRKAEEDAKRARREAADAKSDADEARKGTFTEAKKGDKRSGSSDFDDLGGIFGSFMKETFGLDGSLFPDISNLMPVKALGSILGFAGGLGQDDGSGGAGATASDPFAGMADAGAQTSGLPFGMIPGVSSLLPSSPIDPAAPAIHTGGGGQPGPVDQSTNYTTILNSPTGDPAELEKRHRRLLLQTPRLNTHTPPSTVGGG